MSVVRKMSVLALQGLLDWACKSAGQALAGEAGKLAGDLAARQVKLVAGALHEYFANHSLKLTRALETANGRAWHALELALTGETLWDHVKKFLAPGDERAFGQQVKDFLKTQPLDGLPRRDEEYFGACRRQVKAARDAGLLTGRGLDLSGLAEEAAALAAYREPRDRLAAEWRAVGEVAEALRRSGHETLAEFLSHPVPNGPPLLVVAVRYFFRREVETDQELAHGVTFSQLEGLTHAQEEGFGRLHDALKDNGQELRRILDGIGGVLLSIEEEVKSTRQEVREIGLAVQQLLETRQLLRRPLDSRDSRSANDQERRLAKALLARYRALPREQRERLPAVLNGVGKLQVMIGEFDAAQKDFQSLTTLVPPSRSLAEVHFNAYQAALGQRKWPLALAELNKAAGLDPSRFELFPTDKYRPRQVLGAGGFGVAFLCQQRDTEARVVVKTFRGGDPDRDVVAEARLLESVDHPGVIRLRDCDYMDRAAKSRPYLVMDYFEGQTLEEYVDQYGRLTPEELLPLAVQVAEALQAAHSESVLHRDVKPANILVRRLPSARDERGRADARWQVKLIDFGLATYRTAELATRAGGGEAPSSSGGSGTLEYAAPEQMGRRPGVPVGPHSDVYGFGKTCCYALFQTTQPLPSHWGSLPGRLTRLLEACLQEDPARRVPTFAEVLRGLRPSAGEQRRPGQDPPPRPPSSGTRERRPESDNIPSVVPVRPRTKPWPWLVGGGAATVALVGLVILVGVLLAARPHGKVEPPAWLVGEWESDPIPLSGVPAYRLTINGNGSCTLYDARQNLTTPGTATFADGQLTLTNAAGWLRMKIRQDGQDAFVSESRSYPNGAVDAMPFKFWRTGPVNQSGDKGLYTKP